MLLRTAFRPLALTTALVLLGSFLAVPNQSATAQQPGDEKPVKFDLDALRRIPVLHDGRIKPFDTVAREAVELICGRTKPTLSLVDEIPAAELKSPIYNQAKTLFPGGEPRKWDPVELVFSWMVEPEKWDDVPFLLAEHDELRKDLLEVPVTHPDSGEHLKYISPMQFKEATKYRDELMRLAGRRRSGTKAEELTNRDKKVEALWKSFTLFHQISLDGALDDQARRQLAMNLRSAATRFSALRARLGELIVAVPDLQAPLNSAFTSVQQLDELLEQQSPELAQVEAAALGFATSTEEVAETIHRLRRGREPPENLREYFTELELQLDVLAESGQQVLASIYYNGETICVVPALNAAALEAERDPEEPAQPWLDLQTLLIGSKDNLAALGYPAQDIQQVRIRFAEAKEAYLAKRPDAFATATEDLEDSLRYLARSIEPLRNELEIKKRDEGMMAFTQYPAEGTTQVEVRYNNFEPFFWSWIVSLMALTCAVLAFGVVRKPMLWASIGILAGGLLLTTYGFYLRVLITRWAPVTNMYETVIYVPFVVSVMGLWFFLLPITWPGLRVAWRAAGIPGMASGAIGAGIAAAVSGAVLGAYLSGTSSALIAGVVGGMVGGLAGGLGGLFESAPTSKDQQRMLSDEGWFSVNLAMLLPRAFLSCLLVYILTLAPYAAGDRTILHLLPRTEVDSSSSSIGNLFVWMVGWGVLIPTVFFLPRAVLALLGGLITVPLNLTLTDESLIGKVYQRKPFAVAAPLVAFMGTFIAWYSPVLSESFGPLQPVLRDNFWLTIHVLTIVSSYGAGALAWGLSIIALLYYLFGTYRDPIAPSKTNNRYQPAEGQPERSLARRPPAACNELAGYIYKTQQVAVLLLAAGTLLGGFWADVSWGRFWGWDPKEVWALISLLVYLAVLHARYAGLVGNFGLVAGSVLGMSAISFSWYGVNFVLGAGLHSYGFGAGGQWEVGIFVLANWLLLKWAGMNYWRKTRGGVGAIVDDSSDDDSDDAASEKPAHDQRESSAPETALS